MVQIGIRPGTVVGGGEGYDRIVSRNQADFVVDSVGGLRDALDAAGNGDIVFIEPSADLEVGDISLPPGITLASNRGENGSPGARIFTNRSFSGDGDELIDMGDADRITGLRVEGPLRDTGDPHVGTGIRADRGGEIDNCEVSGFGFAAVSCQDNGTYEVHHCHIHHNQAGGNGYGVTVGGGISAEIYANHIDFCRHGIAGSGRESYDVHDNLFGENNTQQAVDMHGDELDVPGGDRLHIHHNRCEARRMPSHSRHAGDPAWFVLIRGVPMDEAIIEYNWAFNDIIEPTSCADCWTRAVVLQNHTSSPWQNVTVRNNHWSTEPPADQPDQPDEPAPGEHTLDIRSTADTPPMWYFVEATGEIVAQDPEESDTITHDGRWRAEGQVGPTGSDTYTIHADLLAGFGAFHIVGWPDNPEFTEDPVNESRFELLWDGEAVSIADIVDEAAPEPEPKPHNASLPLLGLGLGVAALGASYWRRKQGGD